MRRYSSAVARINSIGVFIIGGAISNQARTSEFLAAGTMEWQEGPALPESMNHICAVVITPTSFLAIGWTSIYELNIAIAGPTSNDSWEEAGRWPTLKKGRGLFGCAKIGQKVIIAGGWASGALSSTEVLDLDSRQISSGGELAAPRYRFHIATIVIEGEEKMFALAGSSTHTLWKTNTVEEWVEESSTWKAADNLVEKRTEFGAVVMPKHLICPA